MSFIGKVVGEITGGNKAIRAQQGAAQTQAAFAQQGQEQQQKQLEALTLLLKPYTDAGVPALQAMQALAGLGPEGSQDQAIERITASPEFAALTQQGEGAILANASATGGLRGGNTQAALGQFRPALLSELINQQYSRLGGLAGIGQQAAGFVGNAGFQTGQGISGLLQQQGAALAGGQIARGGMEYRGFQDAMALAPAVIGAFGGFGGGGGTVGAGGMPAGGGFKPPAGFKFPF